MYILVNEDSYDAAGVRSCKG